MTTTVQQRKRTKGWRAPANSVCVTRPSKWGNPYKVGETYFVMPVHDVTVVENTTAAQAVAMFAAWVHESTDPRAAWIRDHVHELAGKTLLCWCPQPGPCHAHVLAELADT